MNDKEEIRVRDVVLDDLAKLVGVEKGDAIGLVATVSGLKSSLTQAQERIAEFEKDFVLLSDYNHMRENWRSAEQQVDELRGALDEIDDYEADHPPADGTERPATPIQMIVRKALNQENTNTEQEGGSNEHSC